MQRAVKDASENATVDETGAISWKSNGNYLPDDLCEKLEYASFPFSRTATEYAREAQVEAELAEYRKNRKAPTAEDLREMRRTFGPGATVFDVITGEEIKI